MSLTDDFPCINKDLHYNYITLRYITLHYIKLHCITLHYITLHYITTTTKVNVFSFNNSANSHLGFKLFLCSELDPGEIKYDFYKVERWQEIEQQLAGGYDFCVVKKDIQSLAILKNIGFKN